MDRLKLGSLREETLKMLYDLYDGFYIKTYNLVKKNDLHYANSDQEFELFLNFLKDDAIYFTQAELIFASSKLNYKL